MHARSLTIVQEQALLVWTVAFDPAARPVPPMPTARTTIYAMVWKRAQAVFVKQAAHPQWMTITPARQTLAIPQAVSHIRPFQTAHLAIRETAAVIMMFVRQTHAPQTALVCMTQFRAAPQLLFITL